LRHAGGRTDGQTSEEANIHFLQFCEERASKVRNSVVINTLHIKSFTTRPAMMYL